MNEKFISRQDEIIGQIKTELLESANPYNQLNKEMQEMGFQTIQGRIDTKFFYEHFYQTKDYERRNA